MNPAPPVTRSRMGVKVAQATHQEGDDVGGVGPDELRSDPAGGARRPLRSLPWVETAIPSGWIGVSSGGFAFYSLVFGGSAALSLLLTPLALRFATRGRFFDLPTPTKGHKSP